MRSVSFKISDNGVILNGKMTETAKGDYFLTFMAIWSTDTNRYFDQAVSKAESLSKEAPTIAYDLYTAKRLANTHINEDDPEFDWFMGHVSDTQIERFYSKPSIATICEGVKMAMAPQVRKLAKIAREINTQGHTEALDAAYIQLWQWLQLKMAQLSKHKVIVAVNGGTVSVHCGNSYDVKTRSIFKRVLEDNKPRRNKK